MAIRCDHCGEEIADKVFRMEVLARGEDPADLIFCRWLLLCRECLLPLREASAGMVAEFTGDVVKA